MRRKPNTALLVGLMVMLAWDMYPRTADAAKKNRKQAQQFRVSPWRVWGTTGFSYDRTMAQETKPVAHLNSMTTVGGDKSMNGYLWKPWMFRWSSSLGAGFTSTKNTTELREDNASAANTSAVSRNGTGNLNVGIFPISRFPVNMVYTYGINDSSEGDDNGPATRSTALSLTQSLRSEVGGEWNGNVSYDRRINVRGSKTGSGIGILPDLKRETARNITDSYRSGLNANMLGQVIAYNGSYDRNEAKTPEQLYTTRNTSMAVNHDYNHSPFASVNNIANFGINRLNTEDNGSSATSGQNNTNARSSWRQYSNTLSWRSESQPLNVVSSTRVYRNDTNVSTTDISGDKVWTGSQTTNSTLSTNYMFSNSITLGATVMGTYDITHTQESYDAQQSSSQSLNWGFSPPSVNMGEYSYSWNVSASGANSAADNARQQIGSSESAGHSLSRNIKISDETSVNYGVSESGSTNNAHHKKPDFGVSHNVSSLISNTSASANSMANLSLSESRKFVTSHGRTYTSTLQMSRSNSISETENLSGNLSLQWSWSRDEQAETTEATTSSFDVNYNNNEFLNVPQLRFITRLGINNEGLVPLIKDGQTEGYSFSNRLEYQIGMLTVGMTCDMQENIARRVGPSSVLPGGSVEDEPIISATRSALYMLEVRRYFNQVF